MMFENRQNPSKPRATLPKVEELRAKVLCSLNEDGTVTKLKKNILLGHITNLNSENQKKNLDKLFQFSNSNMSSVSFSQKNSADGDRFIVKIINIDSISKAIEVFTKIDS